MKNNRIARAREKAGLTQERLAERLGTTKSSVSKMENGRQRIPADLLVKVAGILNVPVWILYPENIVPPETTEPERKPSGKTRLSRSLRQFDALQRRLDRLADLRDRKILTQKEFEKEKRKILRQK